MTSLECMTYIADHNVTAQFDIYGQVLSLFDCGQAFSGFLPMLRKVLATTKP